MKKILLLDIENIHKTEKELLQLLKQYTFVYLVYAKSPVTLSLDALINFSSYVIDGKLVLIKMPKIGADAADFGLAFLAGQLSIQMSEKDTIFEVMSNDKALEYVVDLLKIMKFNATQTKTATRVAQTNKETTKVKSTAASKKQVVKDFDTTLIPSVDLFYKDSFLVDLKRFCDYLFNAANRPAKEKTLKNTIRSKLDLDDQKVEFLFKYLIKYKIIDGAVDKIKYLDLNLIKWATFNLPDNLFFTKNLNIDSNDKNLSIADQNLPANNGVNDSVEEIRLTLAKRLNVAENLRPKYVVDLTLILKQNFPQKNAEDLLVLLEKNQLLKINDKEIEYGSRLLNP